ncbi:hypothetical protein EV586_10572 [Tumebacillus sp. BK434]|uniref:hypothetical protein n=1 Tax=Tumebacillus sp. BK434 TaxID=2512169 RepID=UPI0010515252|nr:hypothetical protein [Tumebacillus sp. BK434]TCP53728.1 hypothetical protein EV586_10572 [Tumebacillus sp. BK434]
MQQGWDHLPSRYRDDRLYALALDKKRIWVHWAEGTALQKIADRQFPDGWERAPRLLRIESGTGTVRLLPCPAEYGAAFVDGLRSSAEVRVEYGLEMKGEFWPLYETSVRMPGPHAAVSRRRERPDSISSYSIYRVT